MYLQEHCTQCKVPLQVTFNMSELVFEVECINCLKKYTEVDELNQLPAKGYNVDNNAGNKLKANKIKPFYNVQLIPIEGGKNLSISRSGKFYFTQIVDGDKKTPLRPFCSLAEAAEIYPIINNTKITI